MARTLTRQRSACDKRGGAVPRQVQQAFKKGRAAAEAKKVLLSMHMKFRNLVDVLRMFRTFP